MRPEILAVHLAGTIRELHAPLALRVASLETSGGDLHVAVGELRARLDGLEAINPLPGPPGPPGPPGRDGVDGKDGAGLQYLGVHVGGKSYDAGDVVTHGGSAWYCGRSTTGAPGASPDWQLMVKRGRDARGDR